VVFQQWRKERKIAEQWCFGNGEKGDKLLNSGVSAMGKGEKLLNSGVSAMGKKGEKLRNSGVSKMGEK
jgi:hypothetical protein